MVIFWWGEGSLPAPWDGEGKRGAGFWLLQTPLSLPFLRERGAPAAPASEETSAKWVIGNGKWGEGWRQGLGQEVHGHVCSGITREKRGVGKE